MEYAAQGSAGMGAKGRMVRHHQGHDNPRRQAGRRHRPPFGSNQPLVDQQRAVMKKIGNFPETIREFSPERFRLQVLEDEIFSHLKANDPHFDENRFDRTLAILHHYYPPELRRKNGLMAQISHPLLVMRDLALLTNSQRESTPGAFHDIVEDCKGSIHSTLETFAGDIEREIGYEGLGREIIMLTQIRGKSDFVYNVDVYASTSTRIIVAKFVDRLKNMQDLLCSKRIAGTPEWQDFVRETTSKTVQAAEIAKKINGPFFDAIYRFLKLHGHPGLKNDIRALGCKSAHQKELERDGYASVGLSDQVYYQLMLGMPDAETMVLAISRGRDDISVMVPFISGLSAEEASEKLTLSLNGSKLVWHALPSRFVPNLQSYHRMQLPLDPRIRLHHIDNVIPKLPRIVFGPEWKKKHQSKR